MSISRVYKLTTQDGYTRKGKANQLKWGRGVTHTATGTGGLCTSGVIHGYTSPLLAVLLNPIHANLTDPKLWEAEMEITHTDGGLKVGGRTMTTIAEIPLPEVTRRQRIAFANLCVGATLEAAASVASYAADAARAYYATGRGASAHYSARAASCAASYAASHAADAARAAARAANYATASDCAHYSARAAVHAVSAASCVAKYAEVTPLDLDNLAALAMMAQHEGE